MIEEIAWKNKLEILNLFNLLGDQWESHLLPDRLHPSSIGAGKMARQIGSYLILTAGCTEQDKADWLQGKEEFNFHGFCGYQFDCDGAACKIVKPYKEAKGKPFKVVFTHDL